MVHNEYGLDQMLFYELLEEQVQDIALGMTLFVVYALLVCQLLRSSGIGNLVEVNACVFLDSIYIVSLSKGLPRSMVSSA